MIRFATIGTNFITRRFLDAAKNCPELKYAAVYSRSKEKAEDFAKEYQAAKAYDNLTALAEDTEIDAVYIASPIKFHCSHSIEMLTHKKHVLCEKSIASNVDELRKMICVAKENNVVLMEGMRSSYDVGMTKIMENLYKLGKIRRASFQYCQYSSRYDNFKNGIVENAFKLELSNGGLMDIGVYCVHPLVRLFGIPQEIKTMGILLSTGVDGEGTIIANYKDMLAEILYSKISNSCPFSQIQGENGYMTIQTITDPRKVQITYNHGEIEKFEIECCENNMVYEVGEFVKLIENGNQRNDALKYSEMALSVMDEARRQMGVIFPADKQF